MIVAFFLISASVFFVLCCALAAGAQADARALRAEMECAP